MQLLWLPAADQAMTRLEAEPALADVHRAALRTLGRLEVDPFDPRLRTRQFATERYGQLRSTPVGTGDWYVMSMAGPEADEITIAVVAEATL